MKFKFALVFSLILTNCSVQPINPPRMVLKQTPTQPPTPTPTLAAAPSGFIDENTGDEITPSPTAHRQPSVEEMQIVTFPEQPPIEMESLLNYLKTFDDEYFTFIGLNPVYAGQISWKYTISPDRQHWVIYGVTEDSRLIGSIVDDRWGDYPILYISSSEQENGGDSSITGKLKTHRKLRGWGIYLCGRCPHCSKRRG